MFSRLFMTLSATLLLAACTQQPPVANVPTPTFGAPYTLDVAQINIVEQYRSPMAAPNVEHLFKVTPTQQIRGWVNSRLRVGGSANIAEITIKDASVVETKLPRTQGFKGAFTKDQAERYDGHMAVEIRIFAAGELMSKANVSAEISKSQTIREDATLVQRDALFSSMSNEMITMLNAELERNINQYFSNYLTR